MDLFTIIMRLLLGDDTVHTMSGGNTAPPSAY